MLLQLKLLLPNAKVTDLSVSVALALGGHQCASKKNTKLTMQRNHGHYVETAPKEKRKVSQQGESVSKRRIRTNDHHAKPVQ